MTLEKVGRFTFFPRNKTLFSANDFLSNLLFSKIWIRKHIRVLLWVYCLREETTEDDEHSVRTAL